MVKLVIRGKQPEDKEVSEIWLEYRGEDIRVCSSGKGGGHQIMMTIFSDGTYCVPENYNFTIRDDDDGY